MSKCIIIFTKQFNDILIKNYLHMLETLSARDIPLTYSITSLLIFLNRVRSFLFTNYEVENFLALVLELYQIVLENEC